MVLGGEVEVEGVERDGALETAAGRWDYVSGGAGRGMRQGKDGRVQGDGRSGWGEDHGERQKEREGASVDVDVPDVAGNVQQGFLN